MRGRVQSDWVASTADAAPPPPWVGRINEGEPLRIVRRVGDWVRVHAGAAMGGTENWREGWLKLKYVFAAPLATPPPRRGPIFKVGEPLGRWTVTQYLSTGGQAEAYRCVGTDDDPHQHVVVKVFIDENANDTMGNYSEMRTKLKTWFLREDVIMQAVRGCPDTVNHVASGLFRGFWYVAMQSLAESLWSLRNALQRKVLNDTNASFSPETVARTGIQVLNSLECIHARGFAHRDLKPSNLLIGMGAQGYRWAGTEGY
eukprot:gene18066-54329_t